MSKYRVSKTHNYPTVDLRPSYDSWLKAEERNKQPSSRAPKARERIERSKRGEGTFVPTYSDAQTDYQFARRTREERTAQTRKNAMQKKTGYTSTGSAYGDKARSDYARNKAIIRSAMKRK